MPTVPRVAPRPAPAAAVAAVPAAAPKPAGSRFAGSHPPVPEPEGLPTAERATTQLLTLANPAAWLK